MKWNSICWLTILFSIMPLPASAQTLDELERQLEKLKSAEQHRKAAAMNGATPRGRFELRTDGVYDRKHRITWAAHDSEAMSWTRAQDYCAELGAKWSLPKVSELLSLGDEDVPDKLATDQITLNGRWYWSSELDGSAKAWNVAVFAGTRGTTDISYGYYMRALCVRRS